MTLPCSFGLCLKDFKNLSNELVANIFWGNLKTKSIIRKNIFACLFSVHNTISLSRHEQVCLMRLRFERYFSHHGPMMGEVSLET